MSRTSYHLGGANVRSGTHINMGAFSSSVQSYLRSSGYTQKQLADALGLHPKVISRKLNGTDHAQLRHQEIQRTITTLARW